MFISKYIIFLTLLMIGNTSSAVDLVKLDEATLDRPTLTTTSECVDLKELIIKNMPEQVGDEKALERLLSVRSANWFEKFNTGKVVELLDTKFQDGAALPTAPVGKIIGDDGLATLFFNINRNEIRFVNRTRLFNEKLTTAYDARKGQQLVKELLFALGMTEQEANLQFLKNKVLKGGIVEDLKTLPSLRNSVDVETTYFLPRRINDLVVAESYYIAGVSNDGMIAHFRIRWPVLTMVSHEQQAPVSKEEMVANILQRISLTEVNCQRAPQVFSIKLSYVPSLLADGDENDQSEEIARKIVYDLKLLMSYMPYANYEGGNVQMFELF